MDTEAYFDQLAKNIQTLVIQGRAVEAYKICESYLKKYPTAKPLIELRKSIARKLGEENEEKVKKGVKEAKALGDNGKEEEALILLRELLKIAPDSNKLRSLYVKFEEKYREKSAKMEIQFLDKKRQELKQLLDAEQEPQYLEVLNTLENNYKNNAKVQRLVIESKENFIKKEIHKKSELLNSDKFDEISSFIQDLKNIYKDSTYVNELIKTIKKKKMGAQIENIENFIYAGQTSLDTLMRIKKYEESVQVATEILQADPLNKKVRKILTKAKRKAFAKQRVEAVKAILAKLPILKLKYNENREGYVEL